MDFDGMVGRLRGRLPRRLIAMKRDNRPEVAGFAVYFLKVYGQLEIRENFK
jgi:hypothetical protein